VTAGSRLAAHAITAYQRLLSPVLGGQCRFAPSCSEYARLVFLQHGAVRGAALTLARLLRCHPFHPGGYDPPPAG